MLYERSNALHFSEFARRATAARRQHLVAEGRAAEAAQSVVLAVQYLPRLQLN